MTISASEALPRENKEIQWQYVTPSDDWTQASD